MSAKFVLSPEHTEMAKPNQDLSCLGKDWSEVEQEFPFVTEWDRSLLIEGYNWKYNGIGCVAQFVCFNRYLASCLRRSMESLFDRYALYMNLVPPDLVANVEAIGIIICTSELTCHS